MEAKDQVDEPGAEKSRRRTSRLSAREVSIMAIAAATAGGAVAVVACEVVAMAAMANLVCEAVEADIVATVASLKQLLSNSNFIAHQASTDSVTALHHFCDDSRFHISSQKLGGKFRPCSFAHRIYPVLWRLKLSGVMINEDGFAFP
jgi:hypothetical protein